MKSILYLMIGIQSLSALSVEPTKTRTITKFLTVTQTPSKAIKPTEALVTETVLRTVQAPNAEPTSLTVFENALEEVIPQNSFVAEDEDDEIREEEAEGDDDGDDDEDSKVAQEGDNKSQDDIAEFGYKADYFSRRVQNSKSKPQAKGEDEVVNKTDQPSKAATADGIRASSPYHLDPDYRGSENPNELSKVQPAEEQSPSLNKQEEFIFDYDPRDDVPNEYAEYEKDEGFEDEDEEDFEQDEKPSNSDEDYDHDEEYDKENDDDGDHTSKGEKFPNSPATNTKQKQLSKTNKGKQILEPSDSKVIETVYSNFTSNSSTNKTSFKAHGPAKKTDNSFRSIFSPSHNGAEAKSPISWEFFLLLPLLLLI